jgi:hypothetical protein
MNPFELLVEARPGSGDKPTAPPRPRLGGPGGPRPGGH